MTYLQSYDLRTQKESMTLITPHVQEAVRESGIRNGLCLVFCPHTTAAITINENADPSVQTNMVLGLGDLVAHDPRFQHLEGNSPAHIKSSLIGASELVIVRDGRLVLGTWQGLYFMECDGPRQRTFHVQVMGA